MRSLGLPVPIIEAEGTSSLPELWKYVILEKLTGRDLYYELAGMSSAHITRLAEQIVSFQHKVSALPWGRDYGWGQIRVGGGEPTWFYVFHSPQEAAAPVSDGTSLMQMRARVHARKVSLQPYLRTVQPVCFLDDLTTKNVLIHRGELSGIIDFDCVCFGDPLWTIGATAGCIVSDIGIEHLFYFEELCRIADVSCVQRQAVELYAAERALFFLDAAVADRDDARAARLIKAIEMWTVK